MKKTYTVAELAREAGISPTTVRRMLQDERLSEPERDWRDHRVFNDDDLEQLLAIVSVKTPRPAAQPGNAPNAQPE